MYDVSEEYLNALKKPYYEGAVSCIINGIEVNENLIIQDSLSISNQCSGSSDAPIGTVYIGEFSIMFTQEISEFLGISAGEWKGLAVEVKYSIVGTDGLWKTLPVGTFIINEVEYSENGVFVNGFDRMSAFDKELKIDASTLFLWTNKTIFEMLSMCCSACGVTLGLSQAQAQALPNGSVQFTPWAENDITTYRDLISYIAAVSGGFATINRYGLLVIRTYNQNITQQFTAKDRLKGGKVSDYTTKYTALDVDLYNKNYGEELDESPIGKVTVKDGVKMYKSASSSDEVLGTIQKGEEFTITEDDFEGGEWLKVKAQINGTAKEGYIRSTGIKKGTTPYLGTTTSSVIVREKPDSSSTQKVTLSEGQSIVVYWTESGYCRIKATINETIYNGYCDKNAIAKGKQEKSYKKHYSQDNDDGLSIDLGFNPLLMKWKESNRKTIIDRILNAISLIRYTPCELRLVGRAEVDLGDVISLSGGIVSQTQCIVCVQKIEFAGKNETKITCVGANADIASADSKALKVAKSNKGSFVAEKDIEETEIDVSDLTSRVEALESSGDGNKIYTSTADPDETAGNEGDMWVKYETEEPIEILDWVTFKSFSFTTDDIHYDDANVNTTRFAWLLKLYVTMQSSYSGQLLIVTPMGYPSPKPYGIAFNKIVIGQGTVTELGTGGYISPNDFNINDYIGTKLEVNLNNVPGWPDNGATGSIYKVIDGGGSDTKIIDTHWDDYSYYPADPKFKFTIDGYNGAVKFHRFNLNPSGGDLYLNGISVFPYRQGSVLGLMACFREGVGDIHLLNLMPMNDSIIDSSDNVIETITAPNKIKNEHVKIENVWTKRGDPNTSVEYAPAAEWYTSSFGALTVNGKTVDITGPEIPNPIIIPEYGELNGTLIATYLPFGYDPTNPDPGTKIYAPTPQSVSVTQTQTSGTEIGNITVGNTNTKLYAPTTTVTQTLTEGTEIAQVNGTSLYAPSSKIISHTTAEWESLGVSTVSESGVLYVYTDYKQDESEKNIPGFKMGDGNAYVADLPFSSAMFDMHMNNTDIHITAAEREKWNNKVSVLMNEPNNNLFFITG